MVPVNMRVPQQCSTSQPYTASEHGILTFRGQMLRFRTSTLRQGAPAVRRRVMRCTAAAPSTVEAKPRPGEKKGFVEEMRFVAMRLHTKDQAPKEGQKESAEKPLKQWQPSRKGYLRFLTESKQVYDTVESIIAEAPLPEYTGFQNTGLERAAALAQDIAWMQQQYGLTAEPVQEDGPGMAYSRLLQELASSAPPAFLCHYYNIYFAHTAGGRMIGAKVSSMILDGAELAFYKYDGDFRPKLDAVREELNAVAEGWTREQKDQCLQETEKSFSLSGALLRTIMTAAE